MYLQDLGENSFQGGKFSWEEVEKFSAQFYFGLPTIDMHGNASNVDSMDVMSQISRFIWILAILKFLSVGLYDFEQHNKFLSLS